MRLSAPVIAWLNVALHLVGLGLAAAFIRPGSPLTPLPERTAYLAANPIGWQVAWLVWAACALAMVTFTFAVMSRVESPLGPWAAAVAVVAAVIDLACDYVYIFELPRLAQNSDSTIRLFLHREHETNLVSLVGANGLYSVSTLILALAFRRRPAVVWLGAATCAAGVILAAAGVLNSPDLSFWATPITIGLYCVWVLLVARPVRGTGP